METLMILTYTAFCYAVFKLFKIPLNKWTVPTAVLGGVVMIGTVILLMNYNHPYTKVARTAVVTTPIVPLVKGRVTEVPVTPNVPLKEGDVLFKIDPTPYQAAVNEQKAALAKAIQNVKIDGEAWNQAKAGVERARTERDRAKTNYDRYAEANSRGGNAPFSEAQVQNKRDTYLSAEAKLSAAEAAARSGKLKFESQIDGENTDVARLRAMLSNAEFNLEQTVVRAPTDGMVTQLILRPGVIAVPIPLKPVMVFVHAEKTRMLAAFFQNYMQRLDPGSEAEVIYSALPGRIFKGKLDYILPVLAQGQLQAGGNLLSLDKPVAGRVIAVIAMDDDMSSYNLPAGIAGEVAIYTHHVHHVAIIRKILFRMKSWQNYIFGEGH